MTRTHRFVFWILVFILFEIGLILFVDRDLSMQLRDYATQHPAVADFFRAYTDFSKGKWYIGPFALGVMACALLIRHKSLSWKIRDRLRRMGEGFLFLFLAVTVSGIATNILKIFIGRARPVRLEREDLYGFIPFSTDSTLHSFPSGHSTTAFALAFALIALFPRGRIVFIPMAIFFAVSRIVINAHFLSDTLAGAMVGFLTVLALSWFENRDGIPALKRRIFPIDDSKPRT